MNADWLSPMTRQALDAADDLVRQRKRSSRQSQKPVMNDTTPRTVRIAAGGSGAAGRETADRIATEGKALVVAYAGNPG